MLVEGERKETSKRGVDQEGEKEREEKAKPKEGLPPFVFFDSVKILGFEFSFERQLSIFIPVFIVLGALATCLVGGLFQEHSIILFVVIPVGTIVCLTLLYSVVLVNPRAGKSDTVSANSSVPGSIFYSALLIVTLALGWVTLALTWCVSVLYDTDGCRDTKKTQAILSLSTIAGFSIFLTGIFPSESTVWGDDVKVEAGQVVFQCQARSSTYFTITEKVSTILHLTGVFLYVLLVTVCLGLTTDWVGDGLEAVGWVFFGVNAAGIAILIVLKGNYDFNPSFKKNRTLEKMVLTAEMFVVGCTIVFWCVNCLRRIKFLTQVMACVRCDPKMCEIPCLDDLSLNEFEDLCPHCIGEEFC